MDEIEQSDVINTFHEEVRDMITERGKQALLESIHSQRYVIIKTLLDKNPYVTDVEGNTYMHYLFQFADEMSFPIIDELLSSFIDYRLCIIPNREGNCPIHLLSFNSHVREGTQVHKEQCLQDVRELALNRHSHNHTRMGPLPFSLQLLHDHQINTLFNTFEFQKEQDKEFIISHIEWFWCNLPNGQQYTLYELMSGSPVERWCSLTLLQISMFTDYMRFETILERDPGEATRQNEAGISPLQCLVLESNTHHVPFHHICSCVSMLIANGADVYETVNNPFSTKYKKNVFQLASTNPHFFPQHMKSYHPLEWERACFAHTLLFSFFHFPSHFVNFSNPDHFNWKEIQFTDEDKIIQMGKLCSDYLDARHKMFRILWQEQGEDVLAERNVQLEQQRQYLLGEIEDGLQTKSFIPMKMKIRFGINDFFYLHSPERIQLSLQYYEAEHGSNHHELMKNYSTLLHLAEEIKYMLLDQASSQFLQCARHLVQTVDLQQQNQEGKTILHVLLEFMNEGIIIQPDQINKINNQLQQLHQQLQEVEQVLTTIEGTSIDAEWNVEKQKNTLILQLHRVYTSFESLCRVHWYVTTTDMGNINNLLRVTSNLVNELRSYEYLLGKELVKRICQLVNEDVMLNKQITTLPPGENYLIFRSCLETIALDIISLAMKQHLLEKILLIRDHTGHSLDTNNSTVLRTLFYFLNKNEVQMSKEGTDQQMLPLAPGNIRMMSQINKLLFQHQVHEPEIIKQVVEYLQPKQPVRSSRDPNTKYVGGKRVARLKTKRRHCQRRQRTKNTSKIPLNKK